VESDDGEGGNSVRTTASRKQQGESRRLAAGYLQLAAFCDDAEREDKQLDQRACNRGVRRLYCRSITVACVNCKRPFIASEKTPRRELHVLPCGLKRLGDGIATKWLL
jgi:hypothetical protein